MWSNFKQLILGAPIPHSACVRPAGSRGRCNHSKEVICEAWVFFLSSCCPLQFNNAPFEFQLSVYFLSWPPFFFPKGLKLYLDRRRAERLRKDPKILIPFVGKGKKM